MTHKRDGSVLRRAVGALFGVFALVAGLLAAGMGPAQAEPAPVLPGGKKNWVVSVGGLDTAAGNDYRNWVRLGYYEFHTDGTVVTHYWNWSQRDQPVRTNAMTANCGGDVPTCPVRTVEGFAGAPTGEFQGVFAHLADGTLQVTWQRGTGGTDLSRDLVEYWKVETGLAAGGVARITSPTYYGAYMPQGVEVPTPTSASPFSNYSATFGVGYGSNAELGADTRASMNELLTDPVYSTERYRGAFVVAKQGVVGREGAGGDWTFGGGGSGDNPSDPWKACSGAACIGYLQPGAATCAKNGVDDFDRVRYIGELGGGRRNTEEYWCQGLAGAADCYAYNSHPRPMLQVVDDSGRFQGWVGVEAFSHVSTSTGLPNGPEGHWDEGYWGVFDMVSISQLRPGIPASAVNPFSKFTVPYGNSSVSGALRWYDTQVSFMGTNHVVSGCRYAEAVMFMADGSQERLTSSPLCVGMEADGKRIFDQKVMFEEGTGPSRVQVKYWVAAGSSGPYSAAGTVFQCTRSGGCA